MDAELSWEHPCRQDTTKRARDNMVPHPCTGLCESVSRALPHVDQISGRIITVEMAHARLYIRHHYDLWPMLPTAA